MIHVPLGPALERAHGHVQRAALAHLLLPGGRRAPLLERVAGGLGHELHADRQRGRRAHPARAVESGQRLHDPSPVQAGRGWGCRPVRGRGVEAGRAAAVVAPAGGRGQRVRRGDHLGELAAGVVEGLVGVEADHLVERGGHVLAVRPDRARAAPAHRLHEGAGAVLGGVVVGLLQLHLHPVGAGRGALDGGAQTAGGGVIAQAPHGTRRGHGEAAVRTGGPDDGADGLGAQVRQDVSGICSGHSEQSFTDRAGPAPTDTGPAACRPPRSRARTPETFSPTRPGP